MDSPISGRDGHPPSPFEVLSEGDRSVDFRQNGVLLGFAHFKKLRHPGQSAGDVLGLGGLSRDLRQDRSRAHGFSLVDHDDGADGKVIARQALGRSRDYGGAALRVFDGDPRPGIHVPGLHDDAADLAGHLVPSLLHRHPVQNVPELHFP